MFGTLSTIVFKILLPSADVATDILNFKKVLSLQNDPKWQKYEAYTNLPYWIHPGTKGSCIDFRERNFTHEDWANFSTVERAKFVRWYGKDYTDLHPIAYAMIGVLLLSWLMTIPHFYRIEKTLWQRLKGLPFLLCFSWPQYRATEQPQRCRPAKQHL